jgi:hypothetical protein
MIEAYGQAVYGPRKRDFDLTYGGTWFLVNSGTFRTQMPSDEMKLENAGKFKKENGKLTYSHSQEDVLPLGIGMLIFYSIYSNKD